MQAADLASNDYCCLPLYYKANSFLMHDNITGYYMTASSNLYFKNVVVS